MKARPVSQREARRLRKRIEELESILSAQRRRWSTDWPSSVILRSIEIDETTRAVVNTARHLDHAVVVLVGDDGRLKLFGVKP